MKRLFILFLMLCLLPIHLLAQQIHRANGIKITGCYARNGVWAREYPKLSFLMNDPENPRIAECAWARGIAHNTCTRNWEFASSTTEKTNVNFDCNNLAGIPGGDYDATATTLRAFIIYYDKDPLDSKNFPNACKLLNNVEKTLRAIGQLSWSVLKTSEMQEQIKTLKYIGYDIMGVFDDYKGRCQHASDFNWSRGNGKVSGDLSQIMPKFKKVTDVTTAVNDGGGFFMGEGQKVSVKGDYKVTTYSNDTRVVTSEGPIAVDCDWLFTPKGKSLTITFNSKTGAIQEGWDKTASRGHLSDYQKEECNARRKIPMKDEKMPEKTFAGENISIVGNTKLNTDGILVSKNPVAYNCSRMIEPEWKDSRFEVRIERKTGKILQGKARFMIPKEKEDCDSGKMFEGNKDENEPEWNNPKDTKKNKQNTCQKMESDAQKTVYHCTKAQIIGNEKKVVPVISLTDSTPKVILWIYRDGTYEIKQGQVYDLSDKDERNPKKGPKWIMPPPPPVDPDENLRKLQSWEHVDIDGRCDDPDTTEIPLVGDRPGWQITTKCPLDLKGTNTRIVPTGNAPLIVEIYTDGGSPAFHIVKDGKAITVKKEEDAANEERGTLISPRDNGHYADATTPPTQGSGGGGDGGCDESWDGGCADGISGPLGGSSGPTYFYKFVQNFGELEGK